MKADSSRIAHRRGASLCAVALVALGSALGLFLSAGSTGSLGRSSPTVVWNRSLEAFRRGDDRAAASQSRQLLEPIREEIGLRPHALLAAIGLRQALRAGDPDRRERLASSSIEFGAAALAADPGNAAIERNLERARALLPPASGSGQPSTGTPDAEESRPHPRPTSDSDSSGERDPVDREAVEGSRQLEVPAGVNSSSRRQTREDLVELLDRMHLETLRIERSLEPGTEHPLFAPEEVRRTGR